MLEMIALGLLLQEPGDFFDRPEVDFWGTRVPTPAVARREDLWADSTAPEPVKRLLLAPTRAHAEAYLAWQAARLRSLQDAIRAVDEARKPEAPAPAILYFARPGCRWCELEDRELDGLPVERVAADSPLWDRYRVTATPTLVVNGRVLRGFTRREAVLRELAHE
jgi:hypothetical protein